MELIVKADYESISRQAAELLAACMQQAQSKLLCIASGDTPAGMYRHLVQKLQEGQLDVSDWYFTGLDEWAGMNGTDEGSCRWHLDHQFFHPLRIPPERICFFNGRAADLHQECSRVEAFIREHGGIQLAVVGLGLNGHIGMNEPGTPASMRTHVAQIDEETQRVGQKYFTRPVSIEQGLTLGLANLREARNLMLLATGAHKAGIVAKILSAPPTEQIPGTLLRNHPGLSIFLDAAAAQNLKP
jgi:glucosamine-6-phosphate isomerase